MNYPNDRAKLRQLQNRILARKGLVGCGPEFSVALHSRGKAVYTGADRFGQGEITAWEGVSALTCASEYAVALMKDGTLRFTGDSPVDARLQSLSHVRAVSCSRSHIAALLGNGRVVAGVCGKPAASDTAEWPEVFDVVCGRDFTAGLTREGGVVMAGGNHRLRYALSFWENVAGLFADYEGKTLYGITVDGRLLSTARLSRAVRSWRNLIYMAAAGGKLCAVTATGQLCSTSSETRELSGSGYFIACAAAPDHTVALTRDGLVLSAGENRFGQCDTPRFGVLFESFDEFSADRRANHLRVAADERAYQTHLTAARRYGGRLLCGPRLTACITADGRVVTSAVLGQVKQWSRVRAMACGNAHIVALHENGTVSADGNDTDGCTAVSGWTHIKSIAAGKYHTLGLTEDGRVLFCGRNDKGQGDVTAWSGIRRIYAADSYTVGLGCDGVLRLAGTPPFKPDAITEYWNHPADVVVTSTHMAALYPDGGVLSTVNIPASQRPGDGEVPDTGNWQYVRAIAAGEGFTVGLCVGGRVVAAGRNDCGQCDVGDWTDVVAVACGRSYTVGLTADGRVLSAGLQRVGLSQSQALPDSEARSDTITKRPDTESWRDVIALSAGPEHTVAMTREGTVLATGLDEDSQCAATAHFTLFRDARQLYGYGRYRKASDCGETSADLSGGDTVLPQEPPTLIPFGSFSAHLRADSEALTARMTGNDEHLTVLLTDGTPVTYRYDTAALLRETDPAPVDRVTALAKETAYLYADGAVRLRDGFDPNTPLSTLPNKLGDSPFYRVAQMAAGKDHYAVLLADGTVRAFGENDRGQCDTADWRNVTAIAAGEYHTVGLRDDGTVVATGGRHREGGGRPRARTGSAVAHLPRANPCAVEDWRNVCSVVCADNITVGLCSDGTVKAVGSSHYGQCRTEGWRGVVSVATSGNHTVALLGNGRVEAVGRGESGECDTASWYHVVQIAVMPELTLGLRSDGHIYAAGRHHRVLNTLDAVRAVACFGTRRQVFVMTDGTIRIHERGSEFLPASIEGLSLFTPSVDYSVLHRHTARAVPLLTAQRALATFAVGMAHELTLGKGGAVTATGAGDCGQCDLKAASEAVLVAAGPYHSAVLSADGRAVLTGRNAEGQCDAHALNRELDAVGVSAEESRAPTAPSAEQGTAKPTYAWKQVACGHNHTAALRSDGRVYAVGSNPDGRCDTRKWRDALRISCGVRHTVAVLSDGTCVATGDNRFGQCDLSRWKHITMTAAGEFHTVGLRADGRVEAAGDNRKGQCRVEDLRDIVSVACLPEATLCVTAEGRVIIRGGSGQHDKAVEALREVVAIHTCEHRVAALTADRRLVLIP